MCTFLFSRGVDFSLSLFLSLSPLPKLGEKVRALEQDLEATKANFSWNAKELAKSREERRALEGELGQVRDAA